MLKEVKVVPKYVAIQRPNCASYDQDHLDFIARISDLIGYPNISTELGKLVLRIYTNESEYVMHIGDYLVLSGNGKEVVGVWSSWDLEESFSVLDRT